MKESVNAKVASLSFINYQDYLGIGKANGFQNIVVPGAGEPNFDTYKL
jgi:U3 small nucleolar RNA-associated protein 7